MIKVLPILVILLIIGSFAFKFLQISEVKIAGEQNCLTADAASSLIGKNILFLKTADLAESFQQKFDCLREVTVSKVFPNRVVVDVKVDQPVAMIWGTSFVITLRGIVIDKKTDEKLPILYLPPSAKVEKGKRLKGANLLFAIDLLQKLAKSDFVVSNLRFLDEENIAVYSREGVIAMFSSKKPGGKQVDSLQQVLAQSKIDSTKFAKIDLRFDNPVVVYK